MLKIVLFFIIYPLNTDQRKNAGASNSSFSRLWPDDGRSISPNIAFLNILVHDVINLWYYEC